MPYRLRQDQTLADLDIIGRVLDSGKRFVIGAPPRANAGPSFVAELIRRGASFVYVASVKPLADQAGRNFGVGVYHGDTQRPMGPQVVTIPTHLEKFAGQGRILIWEGVTWMVADYGFRHETVDNAVSMLRGDGFTQAIVLEDGPLKKGDPLRLQDKAFKRVDVLDDSPHATLDWVEYSDLKTALLDSVLDTPERPHIISLFSKSGLKDKLVALLEEGEETPLTESTLLDIEEVLKNRDARSDIEVTVFNGDEGSRAEAIDALKRAGAGKPVQVVLTTYRAGLSSDANPILHIAPRFMANHSPHDVQQLIHGTGTSGKPPTTRFYHNFPDSPFTRIHLDKYQAKLKEAALERIRLYKRDLGEELTPLVQEMIDVYESSDLNGARTEDHVRLVTSSLRVNWLQIRHHVHRKSVTNAYSSPEAMKAAMESYGIEFVRGVSHERVAIAPDVKSELDPGQFNEEVEAFFNGELGCSPGVSERAQFLTRYFSADHSKSLMLKYGRAKATWSRLQRRVLAQRPVLREEAEVRDAMYAAFSVGEALDSSEIHQRVLSAVRPIDHVTNEGMTKTKATQTLNLFFETKRKNVRVEGYQDGDPGPEFVKRRIILNDFPLPYPLKPI